jgi:hypothetical protein
MGYSPELDQIAVGEEQLSQAPVPHHERVEYPQDAKKTLA